MSFGIWRNYPLFRVILEEVLENPKGLTEKELLEILRKDHNYDVSRGELYEALLRLELRGYVIVTRVGKEKIVKPAPNIEKLLLS